MFYIIDTIEKRKEVATIVSRLLSSTYSVEIKPYKRNRSLAQNRTMWMWYGVLADHMACEPEDIHEQMKVKVLGVERKMVAGQALIMPKSTTDLDTDGMSRFMDAIFVTHGLPSRTPGRRLGRLSWTPTARRPSAIS